MASNTNLTPASYARLREALLALLAASPETVDGRQAGKLIARLLAESDCSIADLRNFWESPEENLGPFANLTPGVRRHFAAAAEFSYRDFRLAAPPLVERLAHGRADFGLAGLRQGWRWLTTGHQRSSRLALRLGRRWTLFRLRCARALADRLQRTSHHQCPPVYAMWRRCGCDHFAVIESYVAGIVPDARTSPVFVESARRCEAGLVIGVDALMHGGRLYFIESNMNPGLGDAARNPGPGDESLCRRLVDYAAARGYSRIDFYGSSLWTGSLRPDVFLSDRFETSWSATAKARNIELTIIDSPEVGSPLTREARWFTDSPTDGTLAAIARDVASPISRILGTKGRVEALLDRDRERNPGATPIPYPREILGTGTAREFEPGSRFPNLIIKDPNQDMARGITLHKTDGLPEGLLEGASRAYEYLPPDPVSSDDGKHEYASIFRINLMLTVNGPVYLSSRRDISPKALPSNLAPGPVVDPAPYLANVELAARSVRVTSQECELCERFADRLGRILCAFLQERYVSGIRLG